LKLCFAGSNIFTVNKKEMVRVSRALGDPTRLRIYESISACDAMFCGQIVEKFGLTPGTISHHLKILGDAKLIESHREGQFIYSRALPKTIRDYGSSLARIAGNRIAPKKKSRRRTPAAE
jgi:ArsR family transcriptional regulator, arsenate/arsenite/antimonite-responsive transcriptional repressor